MTLETILTAIAIVSFLIVVAGVWMLGSARQAEQGQVSWKRSEIRVPSHGSNNTHKREDGKVW